MPLIRLDNVSLAYGHRALLDRVTLEIHPAERVCLVGRNGEGKSSAIRGHLHLRNRRALYEIMGAALNNWSHSQS